MNGSAKNDQTAGVAFTVFHLVIIIMSFAMLAAPAAAQSAKGSLQIDLFRADDDSFGVTATLIYGGSEGFLVDSEYHNSQAARLAGQIAARDVQLKAIFITHPHDDHYIGLAALHERFPSTPIYMTSMALSEFNKTAENSLAGQRKYKPSETPESLPAPQPLPAKTFLINGQQVEVVSDLQGDYAAKPVNSFVWIPSLRTVIAGDLAFNGVHPWLAGSTEQTRSAWRKSLQKISALHPLVVIAGHKRDVQLPDSPDILVSLTRYLSDFDKAKKHSSNAGELEQVMKQKYPDLGEERFLSLAAKSSFSK